MKNEAFKFSESHGLLASRVVESTEAANQSM
jgi:hypothetical protein